VVCLIQSFGTIWGYAVSMPHNMIWL